MCTRVERFERKELARKEDVDKCVEARSIVELMVRYILLGMVKLGKST